MSCKVIQVQGHPSSSNIKVIEGQDHPRSRSSKVKGIQVNQDIQGYTRSRSSKVRVTHMTFTFCYVCRCEPTPNLETSTLELQHFITSAWTLHLQHFNLNISTLQLDHFRTSTSAREHFNLKGKGWVKVWADTRWRMVKIESRWWWILGKGQFWVKVRVLSDPVRSQSRTGPRAGLGLAQVKLRQGQVLSKSSQSQSHIKVSWRSRWEVG